MTPGDAPQRPTRSRPPARDSHQLQRPDLAAQMVMDILQQRKASEQERKAAAVAQQRGRGERNWRRWLFVLVPACAALTAWNLLGRGGAPRVFSPRELEASLRFKMYLAAQAVEAFRDSAGRLPASLADVRWHDPAVAYMRSDTTYAIIGSESGVHATYHRGDPMAGFTSTFTTLLRDVP